LTNLTVSTLGVRLLLCCLVLSCGCLVLRLSCILSVLVVGSLVLRLSCLLDIRLNRNRPYLPVFSYLSSKLKLVVLSSSSKKATIRKEHPTLFILRFEQIWYVLVNQPEFWPLFLSSLSQPEFWPLFLSSLSSPLHHFAYINLLWLVRSRGNT
jgi:hypothetical protein